MSKIIDSLTLFTTNKRAYTLQPINPLILSIEDEYTDVSSTLEYELSVRLGYKFWTSNTTKELIAEQKCRMLHSFAEHLFEEFRPVLNKLFKRAYAIGDRESISLLSALEEQMFKVT